MKSFSLPLIEHPDSRVYAKLSLEIYRPQVTDAVATFTVFNGTKSRAVSLEGTFLQIDTGADVTLIATGLFHKMGIAPENCSGVQSDPIYPGRFIRLQIDAARIGLSRFSVLGVVSESLSSDPLIMLGLPDMLAAFASLEINWEKKTWAGSARSKG